MYRTSIVPAAGTAQRQQTHDSLNAALEAWLLDCRALRPGSGDRAELIDLDGDERLRWYESAEGGFASGALADAVAEDLDDVAPEHLARAVRALLAPASFDRVTHAPHVYDSTKRDARSMRTV